MPPTAELFKELGLSLLLGLLVGLQRERTAPGVPGMRTFPLISVLGSVAAILSFPLGGWIVAAGLLALAAIIVCSGRKRPTEGHEPPGTTTDLAVLVMYGVGALLVLGPIPVALAVGGGVAVLLQFKGELHGIAARLGNEDLRAIMQFVLITCIILPVLPNQTYGPLAVLNPFEAWLIVVLIVGLSLVGYLAYKFFGADAGVLVSGILGGVVSSTATTVGSARQARDDQMAVRAVAVVILIASTIAFARVLLAVAVVSWTLFVAALIPVGIMAVLMLVPTMLLWVRVRRQHAPVPPPSNPTQLKSAIVFGLMYALVLWGLAAAKTYVGTQGLTTVAALSGLTDMDAITLSAARMTQNDPTFVDQAWRLIVVAAVANFLSKAVLAGILGGRRLLAYLGPLFLLPMAGGVALVLWW